MAHIECFIAPVPNANRESYLAHATKAAAIFKENGASRIMENWGTEVPDGEVTSFLKAVQCREDETVVIGWVEWPSKQARDTGMEKAMAAMQTLFSEEGMPFDGKRLIYAGFDNMLEV